MSEVVTVKKLGVTKNGRTVYDRKKSHFHPEGGLTYEVLEKAIEQVEIKGACYGRNSKKAFIRFDHPIGKSTCVKVYPGDEVVMCKRKGRDGLTPMVKNREGNECNGLCMVFNQIDGTDDLRLITAYIGDGQAPREPWDTSIKGNKERMEAIKFWWTHALLFDPELIDYEADRRILV